MFGQVSEKSGLTVLSTIVIEADVVDIGVRMYVFGKITYCMETICVVLVSQAVPDEKWQWLVLGGGAYG